MHSILREKICVLSLKYIEPCNVIHWWQVPWPTLYVPDCEDSPALVREKRADEMDVHSQMTENSSYACLLYRLLKLETVQSLLLCWLTLKMDQLLQALAFTYCGPLRYTLLCSWFKKLLWLQLFIIILSFIQLLLIFCFQNTDRLSNGFSIPSHGGRKYAWYEYVSYTPLSYRTITSRCSSVGWCAAFWAGGSPVRSPSFDWRLFWLSSIACSCSFEYP